MTIQNVSMVRVQKVLDVFGCDITTVVIVHLGSEEDTDKNIYRRSIILIGADIKEQLFRLVDHSFVREDIIVP